MPDPSFAADSQQSIDKLQKAYASIKAQMSQVIVGQVEVIEQLLIALRAAGQMPVK